MDEVEGLKREANYNSLLLVCACVEEFPTLIHHRCFYQFLLLERKCYEYL